MKQRSGNRSTSTEPVHAKTSPAWIVLFYLLPFVSGSTALIYEMTWAKMLSLTFGSTTLSAAAVIAGFMGGMGIGAWFYHFAYDRSPRPLFLYGIFEIGIAVTTALLSLTFYDLPEVFAQVSNSLGTGSLLTAVRFLSVFGLLLIPAALMGATFPALCTAMIRTSSGVDRHLGMIYGINTLGAACGVVFAGMVLVEGIGLRNSVTLANVLNVAVGIAALLLYRHPAFSGPATEPPSIEESTIPTKIPRRVTGLVLFFSGFATLSYEIVWFRSTRYIFGNSTYALTTVLFVFLTGLALGSMLLKWSTRRKSPERDLMLCQCAIAALSMVTIGLLYWAVQSPTVWEQVSIFSQTVKAAPWWKRLLVQSLLTTVIMLPATILMGLSFPLASRLFLGDIKHLGSRVGGAYLLANLGSILGSILGAVLILPALGSIGGTKAIAVLNLGVAALVGWSIKQSAQKLTRPLAISAGIIFVGVLAIPNAFPFVGDLAKREPPYITEFVEEGDLATVQVLTDPQNSARKAMAIDGYPIGLSAPFAPHPIHGKQLFLAHLPMVLDPRIATTLNIGLGSASTLQALASYKQIKTLDCVEINEPVVHASYLFEESSVLEDPRTRLAVDDAVHYLLKSDQSYDLIISDGKQQISFSGNAILLSREFYQFSKRRMSDDGLFIQWIPTNILTKDLRIHVRTACDVFEHVNIFFYPPDSAIMVASNAQLRGRPHMSDSQFEQSRARQDLIPYHIDSATSLLAHWTGSKRQFDQVLPDGPLNTWDHLHLSYSAFKATVPQWVRAPFDNLYFLIESEITAGKDAAAIFGLQDHPSWNSTRFIHRSHLEAARGNFPLARALAEKAQQINPTNPEALFTAQFMTQREAASKQGQ